MFEGSTPSNEINETENSQESILSSSEGIEESQANQTFADMDFNALLSLGDYSLKAESLDARMRGQDLMLVFDDQNMLVPGSSVIELTDFKGMISKNNGFKANGSIDGLKVNGVEVYFGNEKTFSLASSSLTTELTSVQLAGIELKASGTLSLPDILITLRENDGLIARNFSGSISLSEGISLQGRAESVSIAKQSIKLSIEAGQ